jgi:hypothetical protein
MELKNTEVKKVENRDSAEYIINYDKYLILYYRL